jgi:hypothetical protein
MGSTALRKQFADIADAMDAGRGIVDTVRESLVVLDKEIRVIAGR